jgi:hypothetical protein
MEVMKANCSYRVSICAGLFPANTLIRSSGLHSLAFGFGTFASQKTELPRLHDGLLQESPVQMLMNYPGLMQ